MSVCLALLPFLAIADVSVALKAGQSYGYRVAVTQTEYQGSGDKVSSTIKSEMPIAVRPIAGGRVEVTAGPLFARGRSVGRPRVSNASLSGPIPPAWFFVLPPAGISRPGQKWSGQLSAPAPLPAGLRADYTYRGSRNGFSQVDVHTEQRGNSDLTGDGSLFLDAKSGVPHHGRILFKVAYMRPNMKDRSKMEVNSHMTVECVIR